MNPETELKILAYVDGELPPRERDAVSRIIANDPAARVLADELTASARWLRENEPVVSVPDSREFYWSQIARRIGQAEPDRAARPRPAWWLRFLAPAGAAAAVVVALLMVVRQSPSTGMTPEVRDDVESALEQTSSFTFRSEAEGMTVVWVDTHRN